MLTRQRLPLLLVILSMLLPSGLLADQTDTRLDALFETLQNSQDRSEVSETEMRIWAIWHESGQSDIDDMMKEAAELTGVGDLLAAENIYARIVKQAPEFSEGWNRRATVRFYMGDYDGSLADIEQTLKLEPRHFGAMWGLGMILGLKQDYERAILAFEKLLEINPNSMDARPRIESLKQAIAAEAV